MQLNKKASWVWCTIIIFSCACGISKPIEKIQALSERQSDSVLLVQRALLKNYAFCKCLIEKFPKDSSLVKDGTLFAYLELGSYSNKAYDKVDSFVYLVPMRKYFSKTHSRLDLMKCIDMYNSSELDSFIKTLDHYISVESFNLRK